MSENDQSNNDSGWNLKDVGHTALDVAGLIPGIGEAADVANAVWYAAEGNYLDAGLSLISVIPIVGDVIGKGGKLAKDGKLAKSLGTKASKRILEEILKLDPGKFLKGFGSNKKLAPVLGEIENALRKWQKEIAQNFFKADPTKGVSHCFNKIGKTSNGAAIFPKPNKTTTVLGTFLEDTKRIINDELKLSQSVNIGANPGGFNLLNIPEHVYKNFSAKEFWELYNKPWLDAAIKRGDIIAIATDPRKMANLSRRSKTTGKLEISGFGREILHLMKNGYIYDEASKTMIKKLVK